MGKILSLFLLVILAFGAGFSEDFARFDEGFAGSNAAKKMELLNELQGIYLNSILNGDDELKMEVLPRLITAFKATNQDPTPFENELKSLQKPKTATKSVADTAAKKATSDSAKTATAKSTAAKAAPATAATQKEGDKPGQKKRPADKTFPLKITKITATKNSLILHFNTPPKPAQITAKTLNDKKAFRLIYDISATLGAANFKRTNLLSKNIRIAQFDKSTARVVFEHPSKQKMAFEIEGNQLIFALEKDIKNVVAAKKPTSDSAKTAAKSGTTTTTKPTTAAKPATAKNSDKPATTKPATAKNSDKPAAKPNPKPSQKAKIIVIDPGHGGRDAGAVNGKLYEKNIVLNIALKTGKILQKRGFKVFYTRQTDKFVKLRARTSFANDKNADLFISVHANSVSNKSKALTAQGIETYFLSPTRSERSMSAADIENKAETDEMNYFTKLSFLNFLNREKIIASNKLAIDIQRSMLGAVRREHKVVDGGVRDGPFWVLVGALMPAVLIEVGYISHPDESKLIASDAYANTAAQGIAAGIEAYFEKNR